MDQQNRYSKQITFSEFGQIGQEALQKSSCALIGLGAVGCEIAEWLVRAGIGKLTIVDRDYVELGNLHRQRLYDEKDVSGMLPKPEAGIKRLSGINSNCEITAVSTDFNAENAEAIVSNADLVIDATDNLITRYLINDVCVKQSKPWIYSAAVGGRGAVALFHSGGACFQCYAPEIPRGGELETCDTSGIVGPTAGSVGALAASVAIKSLTGKTQKEEIIYYDTWNLAFEKFALQKNPKCSCCGLKQFNFLNKAFDTEFISMCGKNAVHLHLYGMPKIDLDKLSKNLKSTDPKIFVTEFLLKFQVDGLEIILFEDGRAIFNGTQDKEVAKGIYQKYIQK